MSDFYIYEGPDLDELIEFGLSKLNLDEKDVEIEILREGESGFLGFGKKDYKIKIIPLVPVKLKSKKSDENIDDIVSGIQTDVSKSVNLKIEKTKEGIFIIAISDKKGDLEDVQKCIEENGVVNVDYESIKKFLESSDPRVKIAEYDPDIYKDSEIEVEVEDNDMAAYITVSEPQGGNPPTIEDILKMLESHGVSYGIDEKKIKEVVLDKKYDEKIKVASGKDSIDGRDSHLDYKIDFSKDIKPELLEDGTVDFKNLNIITNVVKGEVLAEVVPATEGENGITVMGVDLIANKGNEMAIESFLGKNVEVSDDYNQIIAEIDGQVIQEGEKIGVTPVYVVDGDVDLNTGNVDFIGSVIVKGSIIDGFNVKAKGNIEVEKTIGSSMVEATGDIIVKGGILGKESGNVKSSQNIIAKFIESSNVNALKNIVVGKAVMHSNLKCNHLVVKEGKGLIVGGVLKVQDLIECKVLGSHLATKTTVYIGIKEEIMKRIETIDNELSHIYDDIDKVSNVVEILENLKNRVEQLPEDKEEKLQKFSALLDQLEEKSETLMNERDTLEEEIEGSQGGQLKVAETIYPGVTITIRKGVMQVKDEIKFASIVYEDGYLKINPFK